MKKLLLILALLPCLAFADPRLVNIVQRNANGIGTSGSYPAFPSITSGPAILTVNMATQDPTFITLGTGLSLDANNNLNAAGGVAQVNSDWNATSGVAQILNKPTIPAAYSFNYGAPVARTIALSTAYTATDTTKAAVFTISPQCSATISLTTGGTCIIQARVAATAPSCSTGTVVATWANGNTGSLTVGLNLTQTIGSPGDVKLPAGYSFIMCQSSGTGATINSAVEQTAG